MMVPQRIQLSRKKGFDLQAVSFALNGLPAVNCARPGPWGNPFVVRERFTSELKFQVETQLIGNDEPPAGTATWRVVWEGIDKLEAIAEAVRLHAEWIPKSQRMKSISKLGATNLACFCPLHRACHCDTLLKLAPPIRYPNCITRIGKIGFGEVWDGPDESETNNDHCGSASKNEGVE